MARKPTGRKPGRPSKADLAARAVARAEATGESVEEAAVAVGGVGKSAVYAHALVMGSAPGASTASGRAVVQAAREVALDALPHPLDARLVGVLAPPAPHLVAGGGKLRADVLASAPPATHAPTLATGAPIERLRAYAAHDGEALVVLADLVADDEPAETVTTLERVRKLIRRVERRALDAKDARFAPLAGVLDRLYARERLLQGAPPARPDVVQEELRRLDGEVLRRIEEHATDPITSEELH